LRVEGEVWWSEVGRGVGCLQGADAVWSGGMRGQVYYRLSGKAASAFDPPAQSKIQVVQVHMLNASSLTPKPKP
jgi:hypothetical protein